MLAPSRHVRRVALAAVGLVAIATAASTSAAPVGTAARAAGAPSRPIVWTNAYGTYSIRPDGASWRQLNDCSLSPFATNGRQLVGGFSSDAGEDHEAPLVLVPADREISADCDSGPRDPSVLRYRLRVRGSQVNSWLSLAWARDGRRVLGVGRVGAGSQTRSIAVVFGTNGSGYRLVAAKDLDGASSHATDAVWSPQGDRIVLGRLFKSGDCPEFVETKTVAVGCTRYELAVMAPDGSSARSLFRPPQIEASQVDDLPEGSALRKLPSISLSPFAWYGGRIFLTTSDLRATDSPDRIAVVNEDGTGFRYLTPRGSNLRRPALSPDGRRIAVVWTPGPNCIRNACGRATALYVMSSAGGPARKVTVRQPLTSQRCSRGSLPGRKTCTGRNIGFDRVAW